MATYARAIRRTTIRGEGVLRSVALVRLSKEESEDSSGWFVLYRCVERLGFPGKKYFAIIRELDAQTTDEALRRFWPYEGEGQGKEFPPFRSSRWKQTSGWLHSVAVSDKFVVGSCVQVAEAARDRRQYYKEESPESGSPYPESETKTRIKTKTPLQNLKKKREELSVRIDLLKNPKHSGSHSDGKELARLSLMLVDVDEQIKLLKDKGTVSIYQEILKEVSQMQAAQ